MKSIYLAAVLLTCCLGVAANPQDPPKSATMPKQMTTVGCISEKDGKYFLTNTAHPSGVELATTEDLKPHVGHKVKITGSMEKAPMMADDKMKMGDSMKHDEMPMMVLKVSAMKMVSDHCNADKTSK